MPGRVRDVLLQQPHPRPIAALDEQHSGRAHHRGGTGQDWVPDHVSLVHSISVTGPRARQP